MILKCDNNLNLVNEEYDGMIKALVDNYVIYNSSKILLYNYSYKKLITMLAKGNDIPHVYKLDKLLELFYHNAHNNKLYKFKIFFIFTTSHQLVNIFYY
jgi:hypothetical protein